MKVKDIHYTIYILIALQINFANSEDIKIKNKFLLGQDYYSNYNIEKNKFEDEIELFLDYRFSVRKKFSESLSGYLGLRTFLSTGEVFQTEDSETNDDNFIEAKEFWLRYNGITKYPNEYFTIGRQRLMEESGLIFGRDIESFTWSLNTTNTKYKAGIAYPYGLYRSNDDDLDKEIRNRLYIFGEFSYWLNFKHRLGIYLIHGSDKFTGKNDVLKTDKSEYVELIWLSFYMNNSYYDYKTNKELTYLISITAQTGSKDIININNDSVSTVNNDIDVSAWMFNSAVKFKPFKDKSINTGFMYSISSGGAPDKNRDRNFSQTGLHSNRGYYTGVQQQVRIFGEASRFDLTNLSSYSIFFSKQSAKWSFSAIGRHYSITDNDGNLSGSSNLNILRKNASTNSSNLGQSIDLYFNYRVLNLFNLGKSELAFNVSHYAPGEYYEKTDDLFSIDLNWIWRL